MKFSSNLKSYNDPRKRRIKKKLLAEKNMLRVKRKLSIYKTLCCVSL